MPLRLSFRFLRSATKQTPDLLHDWHTTRKEDGSTCSFTQQGSGLSFASALHKHWPAGGGSAPAPGWVFYSTGVWNFIRKNEECAAKDIMTCPNLPRHEVCARAGGDIAALLAASGVTKWVWYVHGTYGWNMKMKHEDVHLGRECLLNAAKVAHISPANLIDTWALTNKAKPEWISYGGGYHLSSGDGENDVRHPWLGPVAQALVRIAFRRLGLS